MTDGVQRTSDQNIKFWKGQFQSITSLHKILGQMIWWITFRTTVLLESIRSIERPKNNMIGGWYMSNLILMRKSTGVLQNHVIFFKSNTVMLVSMSLISRLPHFYPAYLDSLPMKKNEKKLQDGYNHQKNGIRWKGKWWKLLERWTWQPWEWKV